MPEVKRPLGKRRPRREDNNIKINFREAVLEDVDRIKLSQDRNCWQTVMNTTMNFRVPQNIENFLTTWKYY